MICAYCHSEIVDDAVFCPHCCTPVEGAQECEGYTYEAFISYRHLPKDREVALKLQKAVEGFSIPRRLRTPGGPKRLGKLFRDEDELPTSSSLSDQIVDALKCSRFLFVVSGPHTNESQWVSREVELFASYHGRDKIRVVLAEGEPDDSFPMLLRTRLAKNSAGELVEVKEEPLAADFRDLSRKHVATEKLRLIAPLIGCGFDDLRQRMKARRMKVITVATSAVAAVSLAFGSFATYQQFQIRENYRQMQINESEELAVKANTLLAQGDRMQAIQVALAALPESESSQDRPYVPAAQLALENALEVYPTGEYWRSCYSLPNDELSHTIASGNGYIVTAEGGGALIVRDLATGVAVCTIDVDGVMGASDAGSLPISEAYFAGNTLICTRGDAIACFDAESGELLWIEQIEYFQGWGRMAISESEKQLAFVTQPYDYHSDELTGDRYMLYILDAKTGAILKQELLPQAGNVGEHRYDAASNSICFVGENTVAVAGGEALFVVDLTSGECAVSDVAYGCVDSVQRFGDQLYVVSKEKSLSSDQPFIIEAFDLAGNKLWDFEREMDEMSSGAVSAHGVILEGQVKVCGVLESGEANRSYVLIAFGNYLILLDVEDGSIYWYEFRDTLIEACTVASYGQSTYILACTAAGDVIWRNMSFSSSYARSCDKNIGEVYRASFIECEDEVYLSTHDLISTGRRVYRFADKVETAGMEPLEEIEYASGFIWSRDRSLLLQYTSTGFVAYDGATLERKYEIQVTSLPLPLTMASTKTNAYCASNGRVYIYGSFVDTQGTKDDGIVSVNVLSADDGSVLASYSVEKEPETGWWLEKQLYELSDKSGAATGVVLLGAHEIRIVDPLSGEMLQSFIREGTIRDAWITETTIILVEQIKDADEGSLHYQYSLVDLETGETINCDLTNSNVGEFASNGDSVASLSEDGARFVALCSDGSVQIFDAKTGKVIWKTEQVPSRVNFLAISATNGNVLLQDGTGTCMLLSGKDGSILRTSSTALPPIRASYGMINDREIMVRWGYAGYWDDFGLAIVSLDEESFGPRCNMPNGFFLTPDDKTVLVGDMFTMTYATVHCYTLDELIALAHETIVGHELTDAERRLYLIE